MVELRSVSSLPRSSEYDGGVKSYTAECVDCEFFKLFKEGKVCLVGRAWKFLDDEKIRKKCTAKRLPIILNKNKAPEPPHEYIIYKPELIDFVNGKIEWLVSLGFKTVLVDREDE